MAFVILCKVGQCTSKRILFLKKCKKGAIKYRNWMNSSMWKGNYEKHFGTPLGKRQLFYACHGERFSLSHINSETWHHSVKQLVEVSGVLKYHHHLRMAELEGTLRIIEFSSCQGGTVGNWTPNLWLHSQMPEPLSYRAMSDTSFMTSMQFQLWHCGPHDVLMAQPE